MAAAYTNFHSCYTHLIGLLDLSVALDPLTDWHNIHAVVFPPILQCYFYETHMFEFLELTSSYLLKNSED